MSDKSLPVEAPMKTPPHLGRVVRQDCIEAQGLTIGDAAEALGVTRQTVDHPVNERGGVSPEMALRLVRAFGSTAGMWSRLQAVREGKGDQIDTVRRLIMTNESI